MRKIWALAALLSSFGTLPGRAANLAGEFVVNSSPVFPQAAYGSPAAAMDERGEALVVWASDFFLTAGRRFAADGKPRGGDFVVGSQGYPYVGPFSAAIDRKGFSVVWVEEAHHRPSFSLVRRFDAAKRPLTDPVHLEPAGGPPAVASDPQGNSVVVRSRGTGVVAQRYDAAGRKTGPELRLGPGGAPRVTLDAQGNSTIVWWSPQGISGRRFTSTGDPRGPAFQVTKPGTSPLLAGNRGGSFVAAWSTDRGIFARPYGPGGAPLRGPVAVTSRLPAGEVSVAMDAAGRFLVTWVCCKDDPSPRILGRYFETSGEPLGGSFQVSLKSSSPEITVTSAAGPPGDFLVVWQRDRIDTPLLVGRRLTWGRRGADPCLAGARSLSCDLAHDGIEPRTSLPLARQPGDVPLLGDVDGDGLADPCLYRSGRFLCDTVRGEGGVPEVEIAFGLPGDVPLLGDPDGEGRDDACVVRGGQILCDTAHNGGTAEVVIPAGAPGETILLGDVDGNGAGDACVLRGGRLLCDTGHDGGAAEVRIPLQLQPGDALLLGDVDADGRDDPCVVRARRFLCDQRHSGTLAPFGGPLPAEPGAVPLLGDVNGI